MRSILKAILYMCLTLPIGCVQKKVLDDIILVDGIGFDHSEQKNILVQFFFPFTCRTGQLKTKH